MKTVSPAKRAEVEEMAGLMVRAACQAVEAVIGPEFGFLVVIQPFDTADKGTIVGGPMPNDKLYELACEAANSLRRGSA